MKRYLPALLASTFLFAACGESATDKGEEENPLTNGKDDSFFRPTEHGAMRMAVANPARITEDEQFHAWTFELSEDATFDLSTEVSQNLDTVMYVYRRDSADESWGRYIKKNDDDGSKISSRVKLEGTEGQYRVIVKAFKKALRGGFSLHGECTGAGCVASSDACGADAFVALPTYTPWTTSCAYDISGVLTGASVSESSGSIGLSEKCALVGVEALAVDLYHEYWDDIVGFDDQFRYDPDEDVFLNFETIKYRFGSVVTVDAGGDEDALEMIFDADDKLLAAYQHNQSPTVDYFCGDSNEAPIAGPDEDCFNTIQRALPHDGETARVSASVTVELAAGVNGGLGVAVARHASQFGLAADYEVSYDLITWMSTSGDEVVDANIESEDGSVQYWVVEEYVRGEWVWVVRQEVDPNEARYICE